MTKKTTRREQYSEPCPALFMAFELGNSTWKLGFSTGLGQKARRRTMVARDLDKLQEEIGAAKERFKLPDSAPVLSCYEAGRDGFWIHRALSQSGIDNLVVDSASIEVNRRARRAKSDRLDVQKLLTMLIRYHYGERKVWSVVAVPSVEEEDRRQLHRELGCLKKEKTRTTNRIHGLLASHGIRMTRLDLSDRKLNAIRIWDRSPLPMGLKNRLSREWAHVQFLREQIRTLEAKRRSIVKAEQTEHVAKVRQLTLLRGVGIQSSWVLVEEFFGWRKFNNRREVGSLAGLTSTPYDSGESRREQGISKAGNSHVRAMAIELAWSWIRYQPRSKLARWYEERFAAAGPRARRVGIVGVARRLLIDLWRFLETGVLPEGAETKAAA